ncbi:MAG TPA: hypothetical protein VF530_04860 [Planctomycetota bacterium]
MTRSRRAGIVSCLGLLALGLFACAGPGGGDGAGTKVLVTLHNYRIAQRFELASESHTDRVTYYSSARDDAARKVQTDEVMSAFLRELERLGLGTHARTGRAPSTATGDVIRWGLEVSSGERQVHWLVGTGSKAEDWQAFERCRDTFLQLYNSTVSYQTVENQSGKQFFDERAQASSQKGGR